MKGTPSKERLKALKDDVYSRRVCHVENANQNVMVLFLAVLHARVYTELSASMIPTQIIAEKAFTVKKLTA